MSSLILVGNHRGKKKSRRHTFKIIVSSASHKLFYSHCPQMPIGPTSTKMKQLCFDCFYYIQEKSDTSLVFGISQDDVW